MTVWIVCYSQGTCRHMAFLPYAFSSGSSNWSLGRISCHKWRTGTSFHRCAQAGVFWAWSYPRTASHSQPQDKCIIFHRVSSSVSWGRSSLGRVCRIQAHHMSGFSGSHQAHHSLHLFLTSVWVFSVAPIWPWVRDYGQVLWHALSSPFLISFSSWFLFCLSSMIWAIFLP